MCPADSAQSRLPRLARTHDFSVAKATRGYLNEAAKSNAPRPSHPTDSPTCVNSMSSCKTPECPSPSSAGTSSANVGDHVLNISELEATSRCEVLCSDINEMNSIDPILLHFYRFRTVRNKLPRPSPLLVHPSNRHPTLSKLPLRHQSKSLHGPLPCKREGLHHPSQRQVCLKAIVTHSL